MICHVSCVNYAFLTLTVLPLRSHGGRKLSTMQSGQPSSSPIFRFLIVSSWASETSTGSLKNNIVIYDYKQALILTWTQSKWLIQKEEESSGIQDKWKRFCPQAEIGLGQSNLHPLQHSCPWLAMFWIFICSDVVLFILVKYERILFLYTCLTFFFYPQRKFL